MVSTWRISHHVVVTIPTYSDTIAATNNARRTYTHGAEITVVVGSWACPGLRCHIIGKNRALGIVDMIWRVN
jgi:hypothetical protein